MPDIVSGQDLRMLGCTAMVPARTDSRLILTNPLRKRLVTVAISGTAPNVASAQILVQCESAALSVSPYAAAVDNSYVYALGKNTLYRTVHSSALDTEGYAVTLYDIDCADPRWLCIYGGHLYLPHDSGGVAVYTTAGVFVRRYDHLLAETSIGVVDTANAYLYAVDSVNARAVVCAIESDGTLTANPEIALPSCKNVVGLIPDTDYIIVACQDRLVLFGTDDRTAPDLIGQVAYTEKINAIVRTGSNSWWLATDDYLDAQADRFNYRNSRAAYLAGNGIFALSGYTGRVIGEADFNPTRPEDIGGDVIDDTFYILQEDGFVLLTESGDKLTQET